jgi:hypothetical protein
MTSFCIANIKNNLFIIPLIHYECIINIFNGDFWFIFSS